MFERLFSRLQVVHRARTEAEREAIYRFRSSVSAGEPRGEPGAVEPEKQALHDPEDDAPYTTHLYVGSTAEVEGALRVRAWKPGTVPPQVFEALSLDLVPGAAGLGVGELGRFLVRPTLRGKVMLPSLAVAGWELLAGEQQMDLVFLTCRPALVDYYRRLGARTYGGRVVTGPDGLELPMMAVLSDEAHLRAVGSPVAGLSEKFFGPGKRAALDPAPFARLFKSEGEALVTDPVKVFTELTHGLLGSPGAEPVFFRALAAPALRRLSSQGFVVSVPDGTLVTREGHAESELFVVLGGSFEVSAAGRTLTMLKKGDLFGEVAFFSKGGLRTATVRARGAGRLVVIRRRFLDELAKHEPQAAIAVLMNLGSILAQRLERSTRQR